MKTDKLRHLLPPCSADSVMYVHVSWTPAGQRRRECQSTHPKEEIWRKISHKF